MPESGNLYVLCERRKCLALFPVKRGEFSTVKSAFGFDTEDEARRWMDRTAAMSDQGKKLMEMVEPFEASKLQ